MQQVLKNPFKNKQVVWSSPWLVALVPFILTLVFSKGFFEKFKLELVSQQETGNTILYYHDLDHDGNSEYLRFTTYQKAQILVHNCEQKLQEVYNLPGKW